MKYESWYTLIYILAKEVKLPPQALQSLPPIQKRGCYLPKHSYLPLPMPKTRSPPAKAIEVAGTDARKRRPVTAAIAVAAANAKKEVTTSQSNSGFPGDHLLWPPIAKKWLPPAKVIVVTSVTMILLSNAWWYRMNCKRKRLAFVRERRDWMYTNGGCFLSLNYWYPHHHCAKL